LNDLASSEIILGSSIDVNDASCVGIIEGNRRIGLHWKTTLTGRGFFNFAVENPFYNISKDDFLKLEVAYYF